ncbi:TIGR02679 family protein [Fodinicola acaciae]|uniref:TIGR02679 family protein n=1 Tax=Fodinicola acaciae TaxID=2681555 RepID=UPI0013D17A1D|nr:TIGR02679 family protein [Fodinicola acaciae]
MDTVRLRRVLGGPDLAWLVTRVRKRLERGETLDITVTLPDATTYQRAAVAQLLGRRSRPGAAVSVSLPAIDEMLRRTGVSPDGLGAAVIALTGPIAARSTNLGTAWEDAFAPLTEFVERQPEYADWYAGVRSSGLLRRLAGSPSSELFSALAAVLARLPASGEPIGSFAKRVAGSADALDDNRPLSTLVLSAARALSDLPDGEGAEWRCEVWASVGLLRDDVASTVLTLGLPGDAFTACGRALTAWQSVGQPVVLTLRQLVRNPPALSASAVYICENPAVVSAAADRLGSSCPPLVCTNGQPRAAVMVLLRLLASAGAQLHYHGDFDWGGIRIANTIFGRLTVQPWQFDTATYVSVCSAGHPLSGSPVAASWDPDLADVMRTAGKAVEEDLVLDTLLTDLSGAKP